MSQTEVQLIKNDAVKTADIADDQVTIAKLNATGTASSSTFLRGDGSFAAAGAGKAHNLVINGAMEIAQRGTSSTTAGIKTVDRFRGDWTGVDNPPTQAQVDVAAGTTPYTEGFRKAFRITNGDQTSGADAGDFIGIDTSLEAQDIAKSGWNYVSSSSNITLSFWIKSSVAQNFYGYLFTSDGTQQNYPFETGALSADTWTKITKTIPGNSNLTFNNDNGAGLQIQLWAYLGTSYTGTLTLNQWAAFAGATRTPNNTATWYTTNVATLEITGVQLEVGSNATDFEHISFADELIKCERYYQKSYDYGTVPGASNAGAGQVLGRFPDSVTNRGDLSVRFSTPMKSIPAVTVYKPYDGTAGQVEDYSAGDGTASGAGRAINSVANIGTKGFGPVKLNSGADGTIGYHYQAEAEV